MKSKKPKNLAPMNEFRKEIKKFMLNLKNELKEKPQKHIYDVNYYFFFVVSGFNRCKNK